MTFVLKVQSQSLIILGWYVPTFSLPNEPNGVLLSAVH